VPVRGSPTNGSTRPDGLPEIRRAEGGNVGREGNVPRDLKGFLVDQRQVRRSAIFMVGTGLLRVPSSADSGVPAASGEGSQNPRTSVPSF